MYVSRFFLPFAPIKQLAGLSSERISISGALGKVPIDSTSCRFKRPGLNLALCSKINESFYVITTLTISYMRACLYDIPVCPRKCNHIPVFRLYIYDIWYVIRVCPRKSRVGAVAHYTVLWTVVDKYRKWPFSAPRRTKSP
jgi:hypothetical protein